MEQIHLSIPQASDWSKDLSFENPDGTPLNVAGYTFVSSFKHSYYTSNVAGNLSITIVNAAAGNTILSLAGNVSANIFPKTYVYDAYMTDNFGNVTRFLEGTLTITPGVTL